MRLFLMCVPFWLWGLSFGATLSAQEGETPAPPVVVPQGEPQWITVWRIAPDDNREGRPCIDLRIVVSAKNEATAIVRSVLYLKDILPEWMVRKMEFFEATPRRIESSEKK